MRYVNGKPIDVSHLARPGRAVLVLRPKASDAWNWLLLHRLQLLAERALHVAQAACTPPEHELVMRDGVPWCTRAEFAEALAQELTSQVFDLAARSGGEAAPSSLPDRRVSA